MRNLLARIAGFCVERPVPVLAATALVALVAAVGALGLEADAGTDQLVDRDSEAFVGTEEFKQEFGDDAVVVLVKGDLEQLVLTSALGRLLALEACLSGNAPEGRCSPTSRRPRRAPRSPTSSRLGWSSAARPSSTSPRSRPSGCSPSSRGAAEEPGARRGRRRGAATPAARGSREADQRAAAQAAAQEVMTGFQQQLLDLALRYGQTGVPRLDDPDLRAAPSSSTAARPGQPKPRFSVFWPSADAALILVRLEPDLSEAERSEAIDQIRAAVADPAFRIRDAEYVVSGVPVVVEGLAEKLSSEIFVLLVAALVVMALTLALLFGPPLRLLPLGDRARRRGARLRPARRLRRLADDGVAGRAPDPDRARGRLRDPVPGPVRRGARRTEPRRPGRRSSRGRRAAGR